MRKNLTYYLSFPCLTQVEPMVEEKGGGFMARLPQFGVLSITGVGESPEETQRDMDKNKRLRFAQYLSEEFETPEPKT